MEDVKNYKLHGYTTVKCGDLYAYVMERAYDIMKEGGYSGFIVPISVFGTDGFMSLQKLILSISDELWVSHFANRPAQIFDGAQKRLTIVINKYIRDTVFSENKIQVKSTSYLRWRKIERDDLISTRMSYIPIKEPYQIITGALEKLEAELNMIFTGKLLCIKNGFLNVLQHLPI